MCFSIRSSTVLLHSSNFSGEYSRPDAIGTSTNRFSLPAGATEGFIKVIYDAKYGEFLGCHMIGTNVDDPNLVVVTEHKEVTIT